MTDSYLSDHITLSEINELPVLRIHNKLASATVVIQGAHIIEYTPAEDKNLFFVSEAEPFKKGEAIRGGIPVCWPWFGSHATDENAPDHGLARETDWEYTIISDTETRSEIRFTLKTDGTNSHFPFKTQAELFVSVGASLVVSLTTFNLSDLPFQLSQALHSYFQCDDVEDVYLFGLSGNHYFDKTRQASGEFPKEFQFDQEIDWVIQDKGGAIVCRGLGDDVNPVRITRMGSRSVVVWNPWQNKAKKLSHFHKPEYQRMFCIEAANAMEDSRLIKPGDSHVIVMELQRILHDEVH